MCVPYGARQEHRRGIRKDLVLYSNLNNFYLVMTKKKKKYVGEPFHSLAPLSACIPWVPRLRSASTIPSKTHPRSTSRHPHRAKVSSSVSAQQSRTEWLLPETRLPSPKASSSSSTKSSLGSRDCILDRAVGVGQWQGLPAAARASPEAAPAVPAATLSPGRFPSPVA